MPKMTVNESITIDAPVDKVYSVLSDFNQWQVWSPWLIMEKGVKVTVSDDAKSYAWEGERVGSGNMKITGEDSNKSIDYDLNFLKPWKSEAKVRFLLEESGDNTNVAWTMDSSLPFFLFWMKKMMTALISMDYGRGLLMLKDYIEEGKVNSELDFKGESDLEGFDYVGITTTCSKDEIGDKMKNDFEKLEKLVCANADNVVGPPFSIYHKFDLVKGKVVYTSGYPVKEVPGDLSSGFVKGKMPSTRIYSIGHKGPYKHLGNAWSSAQSIMRSKEVKKKKGIHPFEIYQNDPTKVNEKELLTDICFAVK